MNEYNEDLAHIHEDGYASFADGAAITLLDLLRKIDPPKKTVVDLGCGGGTLAEIVSKAGFPVRGFDASSAMVDIAKARVPSASFETRAAFDVEFPTCGAVTAIGEVLNYWNGAPDHESSLTDLMLRIYEALIPNGVFLFDVAGLTRSNNQPVQGFKSCDEWSCLVERSRSDKILTRQITTFRRAESGDLFRRSHEEHRYWLYDSNWLHGHLNAAGFEVESLDRYGEVPLFEGQHGFLAFKR